MSVVERTLVKSQPELWQLVDQPERMEGWISALLGRAAEIEVTERQPEERLAWQAEVAEEAASISVALRKKGWGTHVAIAAERPSISEERIETWLEAIFEELSAPERRPFEGLV